LVNRVYRWRVTLNLCSYAIVKDRESQSMPVTPFDIPEQMRQAAEKSVDQAKKAFDGFVDAGQEAVARAEKSSDALRLGAADVTRQALALAEENVAASFDFAHRLVRARSVEEVAAIQQEFLQAQMTKLAEQGKNLGEMMGRVGKAAAGGQEE
jgi:phasin